MNSIAARLFIALFVCLLCLSCVRDKRAACVLDESQAVELAKLEFRKTGRKVEDYSITVQTDTNGENWTVRFDLKVRYPPPGSTHWVRVEKKTGSVAFMSGE